MNWTCPKCSELLYLFGCQWRCVNNHTYDCAKEGYVNLLLAQHKKSKEPGDNKDMVNARRQFLSAGHYAPLATAIGTALKAHLTAKSSVHIHDVGCGEGYYLDSLSPLWDNTDTSLILSGNDISKIAIQKAAKRYKNCHFAVASSFQLPLANESLDGVIQVFAPTEANELARVLKTGGLWVNVEPASKHMVELKQALYQSPQPHQLSDINHPNFQLIKDQAVSFSLTLNDEQERLALLMMTPYYWRVAEGDLPRVLDSMKQVTADFSLRVYQKIAQSTE